MAAPTMAGGLSGHLGAEEETAAAGDGRPSLHRHLAGDRCTERIDDIVLRKCAVLQGGRPFQSKRRYILDILGNLRVSSSGHDGARGDDACDAEAGALLCKTRTEESPYFIMRRAAQSVKIYHSTVTDTLKKL